MRFWRVKGSRRISCSCPEDYEKVFTSEAADVAAGRFQTRGLGDTERAIVELLRQHGQERMTLLEVGGGVGDLQVALLENGVAESAVNVELTPTWEEAASRLLADRGLTERVSRICGDFVDLADGLEAADVVILHRVVCCYPDWKRLLDAAAAKSNRFLAITFPRPFTKPLLTVENVYHRIRHRNFRAFVHAPEAMLNRLQAAPLNPVGRHRSWLWETVILSRSPAL